MPRRRPWRVDDRLLGWLDRTLGPRRTRQSSAARLAFQHVLRRIVAACPPPSHIPSQKWGSALRRAHWRWRERHRVRRAGATIPDVRGRRAAVLRSLRLPASPFKLPAAVRPVVGDDEGWRMGTYNVGGPHIGPGRFARMLSWLARLRVSVWSLSEFRPSPTTRGGGRWDATWYRGCAAHHGYVLLCSAEAPGGGGGGVALLVAQRCLSAGTEAPPPMTEAYRGHLVHWAASARPDALLLVAVYVPHDSKARTALESYLAALLAQQPRAVVLGDINGVTQPGDHVSPQRTGPRAPWKWLREREASGDLVDVLRPSPLTGAPPPHTRVRLYSGTTAYLDRIYLSRSLATEWQDRWSVEVPDVARRPGAADHNPVILSVQSAATASLF